MAQWLDWGNGHDGSPNAISGTVNTYAAMTATSGDPTVTTALSVSAGDQVLLHQTQHATAAGIWEVVKVASTGSGSFTASANLTNSYSTGAQAVLIPQYTGGTISGTVTGSAWNGSVGGIVALMSNGDLTISGSVSASALGFRGGTGTDTSSQVGWQAEGHIGPASGSRNANKNGSGGGGGNYVTSGNPYPGGGGGGGNASSGTSSVNQNGTAKPGVGGDATGNAELTVALFGGGGGKGSFKWTGGRGGNGGNGGGIVFVFAKNITVTGTITVTGGNGENVSYSPNTDDTLGVGGGGAGAGGSVVIKTQTGALGTNRVTAGAGTAGTGLWDNGAMNGGEGSVGRIRCSYFSSISGSTTPALSSAQDLTLNVAGGSGFFNFF